MDCKSIQEANKWRNQIIKDITKKIHILQNASLGEIKIRILNDETNKLLKEKGDWEDRIKQLGGPDWKQLNPQTYDNEGCFKKGDYSYWGAARYLPGVRELYQKQIPNAPAKQKTNLYEKVSCEYYGIGYENEQVLQEEKAMEEYLRKEHDEQNNVQPDSEESDLDKFRLIHFGCDLSSDTALLEKAAMEESNIEKKKEIESLIIQRKK
eukprot:CAMPEP_0170518980 /NCGR_PEP_ID=MMETSP0209-20121228/4545_1 /TAXON_ID=665100 ORGANISM="Litonotus pictus, Strain P1" /NCGR_SAMPLE_ID=MMETSP0209 /ASSEMBLY_ACC=CAM_ASM_000301 /LENGTH=208 /DNA_ID=CAMNT_0010804737 /DNA_START=97 /DNA_END=720 /DNA_ORIENTATION=+